MYTPAPVILSSASFVAAATLPGTSVLAVIARVLLATAGACFALYVLVLAALLCYRAAARRGSGDPAAVPRALSPDR
jgi:hypothetical protein